MLKTAYSTKSLPFGSRPALSAILQTRLNSGEIDPHLGPFLELRPPADCPDWVTLLPNSRFAYDVASAVNHHQTLGLWYTAARAAIASTDSAGRIMMTTSPSSRTSLAVDIRLWRFTSGFRICTTPSSAEKISCTVSPVIAVTDGLASRTL